MAEIRNFSSMIDRIKTAWRADEDLNSFCQDNYSKRHTTFFGLDVNDLPGKDYNPILAVFSFHSTGHGSGGRMTFKMDIGAGVYDKTIIKDEENQTIIYWGLIQAEILRSLAFDALVNAYLGKITVKSETMQINAFPFCTSEMTVEIEVINSNQRRT